MGFEPTTPTLARLCSMPGRLRFAVQSQVKVRELSIGEKLEMPSSHRLEIAINLLNLLALPRGLEPLFSP